MVSDKKRLKKKIFSDEYVKINKNNILGIDYLC